MKSKILIFLTVTTQLISASLAPSLRIQLAHTPDTRSRANMNLILLHKDSTVSTVRGVESLHQLLADSSIISIHASKKIEPTLDSARLQTKCNPVHSGTNLSKSYRGKGVLIGIIDGGFDYTHPSLRKSDGTSRVLRVWDQMDSTGTKPQPFAYGSELIGPATILKQKHDARIGTHGTIVTSMAAGSIIPGSPYYGIAPESDLIFVGTNYESAGVLDAVEYILSAAEAMNRPVVINMSLASPNGSHDGTSPEDRFMEQNMHRGILITAASNSGGNFQHIQFDLKGNDTLRTFTTMPEKEGWVDFWGEPGQTFSIQLAVSDMAGVKKIELPEITLNTSSFDTTVGQGNDTILIQAAGDPSSPQNSKPTILVNILPIAGTPFLNCDISVSITGTKGTIHGWNGMFRNFRTKGIPGYIYGNSEMTIGDGPGTSKGTITTGSWNAKQEYRNIFDSLIVNTPSSENGKISSFSSKGPTIDGRSKPEITAPGQFIAGAYNSFDPDIPSTKFAQQIQYENRMYSFGAEQGTSLAAPIVAGAVALMLEAVPTLKMEDVLTIFKLTAVRDSSMNNPNIWGYGKLDIAAAMKYVETNFTSINSIQKQANGIEFRRTGRTIQFLNESGKGVAGTISIYSVAGKILASKDVTVQECSFEIPQLPAGIYFYKFSTRKYRLSGKLFIPAYL